MPHIADEHRPARCQQSHRLPQHLRQILGVGEILRHRVDDDGVEFTHRQPVDIVGGLGAKHHAPGQFGQLLDLLGQGFDDRCREIGGPVAFAVRGDLRQQQRVADTDFQHPFGTKRQNARDGGIAPFAHLPDRDSLTVVAAVPATEILAEGLGIHGSVMGFVNLLPLADLVALHRFVARLAGGDDISHQPLVLGLAVPAHQHDGLAHFRMAVENVFNLAQFDAEAANLDLVVHASDEFQFAQGVPADSVAGAVHAPACGIGIGDEALRRQTRSAQIAPRQTDTCDIQLTGHTWRHRLQTAVEEVNLGVGDGLADGWRLR